MPGAVIVGDARRARRHDRAQGRPPRDQLGRARRRGDPRSAARAASDSLRAPTRRALEQSVTGRELLPRAQRPPAVPARLRARRRRSSTSRSPPGGGCRRGRLPWHRNDERAMFLGKPRAPIPSPTAATPSTSSRPSTSAATRRATTRPITSASRHSVPRELAETWRWMCPAGVYEIPEDAPAHGDVDVIVNYTNCVQCGAITAKGGRLTTPEGGDGPHLPAACRCASEQRNIRAVCRVHLDRHDRSSPPHRAARGPLRRHAGARRLGGAGLIASRPLAAGATGASGPTGPTRPGDRAPRRRLSACHTDAVAANRYAIFASQTTATAVRGTRRRCRSSFVLEERSAGGGGLRRRSRRPGSALGHLAARGSASSPTATRSPRCPRRPRSACSCARAGSGTATASCATSMRSRRSACSRCSSPTSRSAAIYRARGAIGHDRHLERRRAQRRHCRRGPVRGRADASTARRSRRSRCPASPRAPRRSSSSPDRAAGPVRSLVATADAANAITEPASTARTPHRRLRRVGRVAPARYTWCRHEDRDPS